MFKLDIEEINLQARTGYGRRGEDEGCTEDECIDSAAEYARRDLSRQLHAAGAPDAPLEEQIRALLASHTAVQRAWEGMPARSLIEASVDSDAVTHADLVRRTADHMTALFAPIVARLTREKDMALAARDMLREQRDSAQGRADGLAAILAKAPKQSELDDIRQRAERAERERDGAIASRDAKWAAAERMNESTLAENNALRARVAALEAARESTAKALNWIDGGDYALPSSHRAELEARPEPCVGDDPEGVAASFATSALDK